jgi:dienelactone hydrolase
MFTAQDPLDGIHITATRIEFPGGDGTLVGYLFLPPGDGPFACMIDNHGSQTPPGTIDVSHPQTAAQMMAWGYAYFFPHRAGYGDSPGVPLTEAVTAPRNTPEHDGQMCERLARENDDVIAALDAMAAHPAIDADRIGAMGASLGGIHTLLALARDARFRCGLDFSGGASQWAGHPKIKAMILDAVRTLHAPVCLVQPENDFDTAPTREIAALLDTLGTPHMARVFPRWGVNPAEAHRFCASGQQIWGPWVRPFLDRYL